MVHLHQHDLPFGVVSEWMARGCPDVAVDTETAGLHLHRDRLLVTQLCFQPNEAHLVQFPTPDYAAPHLKTILSHDQTQYLFHYGRFDIAMLHTWLGVSFERVFCTKIASKLVRTYGASHSLGGLCAELLGIKLDKSAQTTDWATTPLSPEQQLYAANDVLFLHGLRDRLLDMLIREARLEVALACFAFLPTRALIDRMGWNDVDIFAH